MQARPAVYLRRQRSDVRGWLRAWGNRGLIGKI